MEFSVAKDALVFLQMAGGGALVYFLYDLFRLMRTSSAKSDLMTQIQDILFWVISFFILFFVLLSADGGRVRFYHFLGMLLGSVLYGVCLSKWVFLCFGRILSFFWRIFKKFFNFLLTPCRFMYNIMYRCAHFVFVPLYSRVKRCFSRCKHNIKRTGKLLLKK